MKTLVKITPDLFSSLSQDMYNEDINYLVNELNVYCEVSNNKYLNIVEQEKNYCSDDKYTNVVKVSANGYSQGEWQEFNLWYNEADIKTKEQKSYLEDLKKQLSRFFTHKNDYFVEKFEYIEQDGKMFIDKEPFDMTTFSIDYIEFPDKDDVLTTYIEIYGKDFDKIEIDIN